MKARFKKIHVILKSKPGVTLLELILATSILAVFMATAAGLLVPIMNTYTATKEATNATILANNIAETISNDLSYAESVVVNSDTKITITKQNGEVVTWESTAVESADEGKIKKNGKDFYSLKYYNGNVVEFDFQNIADPLPAKYTFKINVTGKAAIEKNVSIKFLEK